MDQMRRPEPGEVTPIRELYYQHNANEVMHRSDWIEEPTGQDSLEGRTGQPLRPEGIDTEKDLVLTGRKRAGKTRLAKMLPHEPLGFADPMMEVCRAVLGTSDKSWPDVRGFLRNLGALGRGEDPSTLPRELRNPVHWMALRWRLRRYGAKITGMCSADVWDRFGHTEDFWVDVMESRVKLRGPDTPLAIHNARFPEEVRRFTDGHSFEHLHVLASEDTRRARLQEAGEDPSPDAKTEQLARELDRVARGESPLAMELAQELRPSTVDAVRKRESVVWSDERREPDLQRPTTVLKDAWDSVDEGGQMHATRDEPTPDGDGPDVADLVHSDLEDRVEEGREKYGERLQAGNGRDALVDAYQEVLDTAMYLRQELAERG